MFLIGFHAFRRNLGRQKLKNQNIYFVIFCRFFVILLSFQFCLSFFLSFFVVYFVISVLSVIFLSFFVVFFVISVLSVIFLSFSKNFRSFSLFLRKLAPKRQKMTNFPHNDNKMTKKTTKKNALLQVAKIAFFSKHCHFLVIFLAFFEEFFDIFHYF